MPKRPEEYAPSPWLRAPTAGVAPAKQPWLQWHAPEGWWKKQREAEARGLRLDFHKPGETQAEYIAGEAQVMAEADKRIGPIWFEFKPPLRERLWKEEEVRLAKEAKAPVVPPPVRERPRSATFGPPEAPKQPWEMTQEEFSTYTIPLVRDVNEFPQINRVRKLMEDNAIPVEDIGVTGSHALRVAVPKSDIDIYLKVPAALRDKADDLVSSLAKENIDVLVNWRGVGMPGGTIRGGKAHRRLIEEALSEGKPVPAEVLKDYPELAAKAPKAPPTVERGMPEALELQRDLVKQVMGLGKQAVQRQLALGWTDEQMAGWLSREGFIPSATTSNEDALQVARMLRYELAAKAPAAPAGMQPLTRTEETESALLFRLVGATQAKSRETILQAEFGDAILEGAHSKGLVTRTPKGIYSITLKGRDALREYNNRSTISPWR